MLNSPTILKDEASSICLSKPFATTPLFLNSQYPSELNINSNDDTSDDNDIRKYVRAVESKRITNAT